jgi:hypothetical protein
LALAALRVLPVRLAQPVVLVVLVAPQRLVLCYLLAVAVVGPEEQFRQQSPVAVAGAVQALQAQQDQPAAVQAGLPELLLPQGWSVDQGLLVA